MQRFNDGVRARARKAFGFGLACALSLLSLHNYARAEESEDWHTRGNQILHGHDAVRLSGVNWYGFETTTFVSHGLWAQDYKSILNGVKANGYNLIRIPFSNEMVETNPIPTALSFRTADQTEATFSSATLRGATKSCPRSGRKL